MYKFPFFPAPQHLPVIIPYLAIQHHLSPSLIHHHHTSQLKWPKHCPKKNPNSPPSKSGTSRTWGILNTDEIQNKRTKPNKEDPQERSDNDPARKRGSKGGKQGFFFFLYQFLLLSYIKGKKNFLNVSVLTGIFLFFLYQFLLLS